MGKSEIINKISRIKEYLSILAKLKKDCNQRILSDPEYKGSVLYYFYIISDSCISLAEMVGKYKELPTPGTYHEAIDILGDYEIIPREFSYSFAGIAGFRNLLAHDYERLDYLRICLEMFDLLNDVKKYIEYIDKKIF